MKADIKSLTTKEAEKRLKKYGLNEIKEKKAGVFLKFLKWFISPIALMLLAAAGLSLFVGKTFDFYFILALMLINFFVGFWQEKKADNAIEKLGEKLSVQVKVLRDNEWKWIEAKFIVPGDIIDLNLGDIIPADVELLEAKSFSVNEASITGESMPKEKKVGDKCFSGSFVALGWARCRVSATGKNTYFGNILISIDQDREKSLLEKDILSISKWLSLLSLVAVLVLTVLFVLAKRPLTEILTLDLSLIIAGIPISLPTIMTLIISFGVLGLAKKKTIVRRLSALEDLANVNLLLSDKTGTLTKNEITVEKIITFNKHSEDDVLRFAFATTRENDRNPINEAVRKKVGAQNLKIGYKILDFIPFDSSRKRSTSKILFQEEKITVRTGAPQIIESFCNLRGEVKKKFDEDISRAAQDGYRTVAVAIRKSESHEDMKLLGLLFFSDTLEEGVRKTVQFIRKNGIKIKMLSGDNIAIASRVAKNIGLLGKSVNEKILGKKLNELSLKEFKDIDSFAEILPEDKYSLVKLAQKEYVVAVTGDGVNDLPALKASNVSIAVKNAVDALKGSVDFVLTGSGISVIKNAIIESRKIFERLYAYSVYRISESFRVIITIAILGAIYGEYPLLPIQLILLALLNDIPIISLAFNRVKIAPRPSKIDAKARLLLSTLFGSAGFINSILFVLIFRNLLHFDWDIIQTLFFLKLTVSGHMLIYVAHTKERWYRYLPSPSVIWATTITQILATTLALLGIFMTKVSWELVVFVWLWAFLWMQVSEVTKDIKNKIK